MRIVAVVFLTAIIPSAALATDCPAGAKSCKVLTLTGEEENALIQKNGILDTAAQCRFLDLGPAVKYMIDKIATAPTGTIKPGESPKDQSKPPVPK